MSTDKSVSFPIRMPQALAEKLDEAVRLTGLSKQDVARLAIMIGIEDLRRCNYDLAGAIVDKAKGPYTAPVVQFPSQDLSQAAEAPTPYKTGTKPRH